MGSDICSDERREDEGVERIGRGVIIYGGDDRAERLARTSEGKTEEPCRILSLETHLPGISRQREGSLEFANPK